MVGATPCEIGMIGGAGHSRAMMTRDEINAWFTTHKGVAHMLNVATRDYVGARCCVLNRLVLPGFVLGAQAAEKYLKAVLLCTGQTPGEKHPLKVLLERASAIIPQHSRFLSLMTTLRYAYRERYGPVDRPQGSGYSSADLAVLDCGSDFAIESLFARDFHVETSGLENLEGGASRLRVKIIVKSIGPQDDLAITDCRWSRQ